MLRGPAHFLRIPIFAITLALLSSLALSQELAPPAPAGLSIEERLARQEAELKALRAELANQTHQVQSLPAVEPLPPVDKPGDAPAEDPRFDSIEKKIESLQKDVDKANKKVKEDVWEDMSNDKWNVKLGGHVQADYITWADREGVPPAYNYFEFRRLRLVGEGTGYGVYDFRLQLTLEPEAVGESNPPATSPEVKDAYFSINEIPWIGRARIGNFFVPFGLEQVTNDTNTVFLERSIPTQGVFTADREPGIAFYTHTPSFNSTLSGGVFIDNISDSLKERIDDNMGCRVCLRATHLPYYDEPSNGRYLIHTGAGVMYTNDHDDVARFRARPEIHEGPRLIDTGPLAADDYVTGNVELAVVAGPVALQAEAYLCQVNMNTGGPEALSGAYVHGCWFLTGENRNYERFGQHGAQFARATPFNNVFFVPGCCSLGAWELKARWAQMNTNSVGTGEYNDMTVGFNWYWSDRVRCLFDWIHPITTANTVFGVTKTDIIGMRFDFNW